MWEEHRNLPEGTLRLLSVEEVRELFREGRELARTSGRDTALCSNACLIARALERDGRPVFRDGRQALEHLAPETIAEISDAWGEFNAQCNPSVRDSEEHIREYKASLAQMPYERLRWRVLRAFGALPTEERVRRMTERDYLWCALNLVLDWDEELGRLCPHCRERAEEERCPVCGEPRANWGWNENFDAARFEGRKGEGI